MSVLRAAVRKCYDAQARSYISHPRHVPRNIAHVTRLKQVPHRFYSEEKGKEKENGSDQSDVQNEKLSDNGSATKQSEGSSAQKSDREVEFAAQLQAKQDEITDLVVSFVAPFFFTRTYLF